MIKRYMTYKNTSVYAIYYIAQNTIFYNVLCQGRHGLIRIER